MKLEGVLRRITELIVRCCDPEEVLLFGSYAKQHNNLDSDLDILVIGRFRESRYLRGQEMRELLQRSPIKIDLHCMTPEEITLESTKPFEFLQSAQSSSVILYSRRDARELGNARRRFNDP